MDLQERDEFLDTLCRLLQDAGERCGCLLLVGGEAGVGKTALLRRLTVEARSTATVMIGQCDALTTPRPLGPLFDIASADPGLQQLLNDNAPRDLLFRTVLARLKTDRRPILLAIEDAHWADEATLDLLRFLGRRIDVTRSLVIVTYRDDEVGPRHPFRRLLGDLALVTSVQRLTVPPLTLQGVAALASGSGVDSHELYARTRGNPFFVTAVLAAGGAMPPTVRDAVMARAFRLPPAAWSVLEAVAIIGSVADLVLLNEVAGSAVENLEVCLENGILEYQDQVVAFRHELAREAILTTISPARRAALHATVLSVLEAGRADLQDPALLAHHAEGADDRAAVLRHAPAAARRAGHLDAHREEAHQYERALRFAGHLPAAERAHLLEARAYACYLTAQIVQAVAAREAALAAWIEIGNRRKEGENRCHLAILRWAEARIGDADREAMAAVTVLENLPPGPELAMAYGTLARLRGTTLDDDEAIAWGERAISLAERLGATTTLVDALITVGAANLARGRVELGHEQLERSISLSTAAGLDDLSVRAHANLGFGYDEHYRFERAAHHFARGIEFATERDLDNARQHMTAWLAHCHLFLGDWTQAADLAGSVLAAPDVAPVTHFVALLVHAMVRIRRGEPGAEPLLDAALALAEASGSLYHLGPIRAARAEAAFFRGDRSSVVTEASAALDLALRMSSAMVSRANPPIAPLARGR